MCVSVLLECVCVCVLLECDCGRDLWSAVGKEIYDDSIVRPGAPQLCTEPGDHSLTK